MQSVSIHRASELRPDLKSAVEQLLGRPIQPDEEVSVVATPSQEPASSADRAATARKLQTFLDQRAQKLGPVSAEEIDSVIDEVVVLARHSRG